MKILVIDVGGTHVKLLATGHRKRVEFPSGPKMTPAKMVAAVRAATAGWKYDAVSRFLIDYPFANRLFPDSLDVIEHVNRWGAAILLTDGDVVFQPRKVDRSGLYEAVGGCALVYMHKEHELADVEGRYPAVRYVMVDDKLRILAAIKKIWGRRVTTVFVRQGHYALDPNILAAYPAADASIERIGEMLGYDLQDFRSGVQGT